MLNLKSSSAACLSMLTLMALLSVSSCTTQKYDPGKTSVTIYETYQQPEMLPVMALIDFKADSIGAMRYSNLVNWLLKSNSEPVSFDINDYLRTNQQNTLFYHLVTNVKKTNKPIASPFKQSSFLGFSTAPDTGVVNKILTDAGFTKCGTVLKWIPYDSAYHGANPWLDNDTSYWGLVARNPSAKNVTLNMNDIKEIKEKQVHGNFLWNLYRRMVGPVDYYVAVSFTDTGAEKIHSAFRDDSSVLVKLNYNHKEYYNSFTPGQMEDGVVFLTEEKK